MINIDAHDIKNKKVSISIINRGVSQPQKIETKVHMKASAEQFYDVFCNRLHHIPNISPQQVQSVQIQKGEWGTEGSIISWNYIHDGNSCVAKEVVEGIDRENYKLSFKVLEGDLLGHYKSFKSNLQVTPKENGSVVMYTVEYEKQENHIPDPHTVLQVGVELIKNIDSYLTQEHN
ncbi:hypothetical protein VNO80_26391 [Phaseolus coccineus]|uniref:Bet v I/Major latex protein domain-containing protein n=1 Tax=Phaseolus coccineus TaxID=3886 RepID=A0AAN9LFH8_PHACN